MDTLKADTHIALVGGGVMAEAMIRGMLAKGLLAPERILVGEPLATRRAYLSERLGVSTTDSNASVVRRAQIVILAVKPQMLGQVLGDLAGKVDASILLLSIVAGAKIQRIQTALGVRAVVRVMPNTPAQVGEGISAWTTTPETSPQQREWARQIIGSFGEEVYVPTEDHVDMATALSGSGPGYVFLFLEALTDAGVQMGFAREVAERLALQTVKGSAIFAQKSGLHPAVLRNMVTSPGGTTAAALYQLEKGGLRATVAEAILAAYHRAQYLGGLSNE